MMGREKRPEISVIMLTYNRENFIEHAIKSVLMQTMIEFEFIIVDNGSTDRSGEIAEEYSRIDSRIHVIHLQKSTIGKARKIGLEKSRGEFVTFIDDDDRVEPDMLEFLYRLATSSRADISICGSTKEIEGKIQPHQVYEEKLVMNTEEAMVTLLKRKKYNSGLPAKLLKRDLFDKIEFNTTGKYEDIHITYKLFSEAKCVAAQGLPKYHVYRHPGNNSAFTTSDLLLTPEQLEEYFAAFRERTEYISVKLPKLADYALYSEWSYMISMCNKIISNHLDHCSKQLDYVKKELSEHYDEFYDSPYIEEFEKEWLSRYIVKIQ